VHVHVLITFKLLLLVGWINSDISNNRFTGNIPSAMPTTNLQTMCESIDTITQRNMITL
jgi:hypothetical protein